MKSGCNIKFGGLYYRTKKMEKKTVSPRAYGLLLNICKDRRNPNSSILQLKNLMIVNSHSPGNRAVTP